LIQNNLATSQENTQSNVHVLSMVDSVYGSFYLGGHELAVPARCLRDVINPPETLTRQPLAPAHLLGIVKLRDMMIPVVDLRTLLGVEDDRPPKDDMKIAIIEYGAYNVGMLFDATGEVFRTDRIRKDFTDYSDTNTRGVIRGAFRLEDGARMVQILNPQAVIEFDGAPLMRDVAQVEKVQRETPKRGKQRQSISFMLGDAAFGIDTTAVQEIVKVGEVDTRMTIGGLFAGSTTLRGDKLALIDLARALQISDKPVDLSEPDKHVVVVDGAGQRFGLVVGNICNITKFYGDELSVFPVFAEGMPEIFMGSITVNSGDEVLQIDIARLLELEDIASAIRHCGDLFERLLDGETNNSRITRLETFLTFRIDRIYGLPILEVAEVVDYPADLLQPPLLSDHVDGILDLRGEMISVVNARRVYGIADSGGQSKQIIIFERDEERFALAIDAVESIAHVPVDNGRPLPESANIQDQVINHDVREAIFYSPKENASMQDLLSLDLDAVANRIRACNKNAISTADIVHAAEAPPTATLIVDTNNEENQETAPT